MTIIGVMLIARCFNEAGAKAPDIRGEDSVVQHPDFAWLQ